MDSITICLLALVFFPLIDGKLILKVILNDGKLPTNPAAFCNANDLEVMLKVLEVAEVAGRSDVAYEIPHMTYPDVTGTTKMMNSGSVTPDQNAIPTSSNSQFSSKASASSTGMSNGLPGFGNRNLKDYPAKCKQNCRGYATGTCIAKDCQGYRRTLRQSNRNLQNLSKTQDRQCNEGIADLKKRIKSLIPILSKDCRPIVQSKMNVTCFDDVRYAQVESFTFWNATTGAAIQENVKNGDTFCSQDNINIEAVANYCVETITLRLQGPFSTTNENVKVGPYTIFGITNDTYNGNMLPVGAYTLNTELPGSLQPQSALSFTIENC